MWGAGFFFYTFSVFGLQAWKTQIFEVSGSFRYKITSKITCRGLTNCIDLQSHLDIKLHIGITLKEYYARVCVHIMYRAFSKEVLNINRNH